ncbi:MAG: hypothetical protein HWD58_08950 [Bacteroidota bacterium]|nr:hypothetical protein [Chitinophagaceae bacterium]QLH45727.1 MAG: hypothetical protein HWD58_08950 [Bacteroidota bacterium]
MANTFEQWKDEVLRQLAARKIDIELDDDLLFMSYDMEHLSPEDVVDEIVKNLNPER